VLGTLSEGTVLTGARLVGFAILGEGVGESLVSSPLRGDLELGLGGGGIDIEGGTFALSRVCFPSLLGDSSDVAWESSNLRVGTSSAGAAGVALGVLSSSGERSRLGSSCCSVALERETCAAFDIARVAP